MLWWVPRKSPGFVGDGAVLYGRDETIDLFWLWMPMAIVGRRLACFLH